MTKGNAIKGHALGFVIPIKEVGRVNYLCATMIIPQKCFVRCAAQWLNSISQFFGTSESSALQTLKFKL